MKIKGPSLAIKRIYERADFDAEFAVKNSWVINCAVKHRLALCGSVGVGVATNHPTRKPSDIDFVTDNPEDARACILAIEDFLSTKSVHYRKLVNHRTKFCPKFTQSHYRIICPFWMEICIFVLDSDQIKLDFFYRDGVKVQNYRQMYDAAKQLEETDGKKRVNGLSERFDSMLDLQDDPFDSDPSDPSDQSNQFRNTNKYAQ